MTALSAALISLGVGLIAGYLGQRSRFCFVGAFRDLFLVGDWRGPGGVASFVGAAALAFLVGSRLGSPAMADYPAYAGQLGLREPAAASSAKADGIREIFVYEDL